MAEVTLEARVDTLESDVARMKGRIESGDKRFDKIDGELEKIQNKMEQQAKDQVKTETYLKVTRDDVAAVKVNVSKVADNLDIILQGFNDQRTRTEATRGERLEKVFLLLIAAVIGFALSHVKIF